MHIIHVAAELAPIAKVGGLGDVVLGLCRELTQKDHDVDIIIPKYDCINNEEIRDLVIDSPDVPSFYEGAWHHNTIWVGWVENIKVYFIEPHHPRYFFNRGCFYGCEDDVERFLYFSRAALEFIYKRFLKPDIIHLHDWQTFAILPLFEDIYKPLGMTHPKTVITMHNMEYQGICAPSDLNKIGLNGSHYLQADLMQDTRYPHLVNLAKGAIVYSNYATTVSPTYAKEVLTPEYGLGLENTLIKYKDKFKGILNGLDYTYWSPETDRYLPAHFCAREEPINKQDRCTIANKAFVKRKLREALSISEEYRPIVGCIARLVPQKGIDLIIHAMTHVIENKGQFVLLGHSPIPSINAEFHRLKHEFADNPHIHLILNHQEDLAHLIFGGSDIFIVPSIFEPCGLTQLIALKYGAIPVVRRTGGLADTIFDVDDSKLPLGQANGYTFDTPDAVGLDSALDRAIQCWFEQPDRWRQLMIHGMQMDFSWNEPADEYLKIYKSL